MVEIFDHFLPGPKLLLASCEAVLMSAMLAILLLSTSTLSTDQVQALRSVAEFSLASSAVVITAMIAVGLYNYDVLASIRLTFTRMIVALILIVPMIHLLVVATEGQGGMRNDWVAFWLEMALVWFLTV